MDLAGGSDGTMQRRTDYGLTCVAVLLGAMPSAGRTGVDISLDAVKEEKDWGNWKVVAPVLCPQRSSELCQRVIIDCYAIQGESNEVCHQTAIAVLRSNSRVSCSSRVCSPFRGYLRMV